MRGFVALVRREVRDLRWHFATALVLGAATPWALHAWAMDGASGFTVATAGGRVIVPLLFGLFTAATAADLVSREVATRRIDALAALPVPVSRVWAAKFAVLVATSLAFLAWIIAADWSAITVTCPRDAAGRLPVELFEAVPTLLLGLAFGMASLFFSTLVERGMSAAFAAIVAIVAAVAGIELAQMTAVSGAFTTIAAYSVPFALAVAFAAASQHAFVRGPIHGPSKVRVAVKGFGSLAIVLVPASAALAFGLGVTADIAPGRTPLRRVAYVSPNGQWVAVEDDDGDGCSRTWLVGIADGSCRPITSGPSSFVSGNAWLAGSMLRVCTTTFSIVDGPLHATILEIEPTHLGVANSEWAKIGDLRAHEPPRAGVIEGDCTVVCDGVVKLVAPDGGVLRQLYPPTDTKKGN